MYITPISITIPTCIYIYIHTYTYTYIHRMYTIRLFAPIPKVRGCSLCQNNLTHALRRSVSYISPSSPTAPPTPSLAAMMSFLTIHPLHRVSKYYVISLILRESVFFIYFIFYFLSFFKNKKLMCTVGQVVFEHVRYDMPRAL